MRLTKNVVAFINGKVVASDIISCDNRPLVATINSELMQYGYTLTEKALEKLSTNSDSYIVNWATEIFSYLKEVLGEGSYKPFHPNFPMSVMAMGEYELYMYALVHYWSNGTWFPSEELVKKGYGYESVEFKKIDLYTQTEFMQIFTNLLSVNQALSPINNEIIDWFLRTYSKEDLILPNAIPFKETLCRLASKGIDVPVKTPTDVLRIAMYFSNGSTELNLPDKLIQLNSWSKQKDINPARNNFKFKKFTRSERRYLLGLLDKCADPSEMVLKKEMWLRLGEILHPGEYRVSFPSAWKAFDSIRNTDVRSWYSHVDSEFKRSFPSGLNILAQRPGEYARRLDSLLRHSDETVILVLDTFLQIADKISNKVLFELISHFYSRSESKERRLFIKGSRKAVTLPTLPPLNQSIIDYTISVIFKVLEKKFSKKDLLGKVYIDERLKYVALPLSMRNISFSTKPVVRGTSIPLQVNKKVVRAFVHWTAGVDLDLSVQLFNAKTGESNSCTYHNLRPCAGIYHSGDVIPRIPGNWAEYVDIELDKIPYDYALIEVRNFRGEPLKNTGAVLGFMEREYPESNTTWYPKTITSCYQLNSNGSNVMIALINLKKKEWILIDQDATGIPVSFGRNIMELVKYYSQPPKFSAYDLLLTHISVRGQLEKSIEEADIKFTFEDFTESYEKIYQYMTD